MTRKTINLKIQTAIYDQLHNRAETTGESKTQLVEKALSEYLAKDSKKDVEDSDSATYSTTSTNSKVEQTEPPKQGELQTQVEDLKAENTELWTQVNRLFTIINKELPQRYVEKDATYSTTTPTTTETPDTEKTGENIDSNTDKNLETEEIKGSAIAPTIDVESTATYSTIATQNNETPTSEEKNGGSSPNLRNGEATIPQPQDNFRQHSTTSTNTARTEETDHSEKPTTVEAEGSAIAPPETPEKQLAKDERLLNAIERYLPDKHLKPLADTFLKLLKEYGIEDESFKFPKRAEARYIKEFLGLEGKPRPKEGSKYYRAAIILWEAHENAKDRNEL